MNVKKYLERIEFTDKLKFDVKTLKTLHKNHLYNIPFENLDIHNNKKLILDEKYLSDKIFNKNRGGYCYELNGMFYLLLKELGFNAKIVSARVNNGKGGWGEEFDHLAIIVKLNEEWLVDVGFGDNFIEPIKFEVDLLQENLNGWYKIVKFDDEYFKLMRSNDNENFSDEYLFSTIGREWKEFEGMNSYHQTSPESHFTQKKICSMATNDGRISLTNDKLIITKNGERKETEIKNEGEFNEALYNYFRIANNK